MPVHSDWVGELRSGVRMYDWCMIPKYILQERRNLLYLKQRENPKISNVPRKLLRFWSPTQSNVVPLWLDPQSYSYFDAQPEKRGFFYDCPPKLYTFRRPRNSIWILEFWRRNRRKRQSHKILISIICRSELELRNFTNFKWIIMGQLLRGFLKDGM